MADNNLLVVNENNFDEIINSDKVVLIDFWAEWCGPCKMFLPTLQEIAEEFTGEAIIGKVNVDENPGLAEKYGVMSIPTVYIFHKGKEIDKFSGARPKPLVSNMLKKHISEAK